MIFILMIILLNFISFEKLAEKWNPKTTNKTKRNSEEIYNLITYYVMMVRCAEGCLIDWWHTTPKELISRWWWKLILVVVWNAMNDPESWKIVVVGDYCCRSKQLKETLINSFLFNWKKIFQWSLWIRRRDWWNTQRENSIMKNSCLFSQQLRDTDTDGGERELAAN